MTLGNVLALRQTSVKRLLASSSIAQAGFVLVAVAAIGRADLALPALGLYLVAYLARNLAAFLVVGIVERATGSDAITSFRGLGFTSPLLAAAMAVLLLSLAGVPPLLGFVAKVVLLLAAMQANLVWLAVVLAANAAVTVAYYLRVIAAMYFEPAAGPAVGATTTRAAVVLGAGGTLLLGLLPAPVVALAFLARTLI
jgi:NADH-quinone oxidoreductase subunit N